MPVYSVCLTSDLSALEIYLIFHYGLVIGLFVLFLIVCYFYFGGKRK